MTQWCIHCRADLFAIDRDERQRRLALRKAAVVGAALLLSGGAWWVQSYLPPSWRMWAMGFGVLTLFLATALTKD
jgi:hypothetical protein